MIATYDGSLVAPALCEGASWGDCLPMRQIKNISTVPDVTTSYRPVAHHVGIDLVEDALVRRNFNVSEPRHYVAKNRKQFWSMYTVGHSLLPDTGGEFTWEIAVRNSYDRTMSFGVAVGTRIFVCTNGMLNADSFMKTRHTKNVWDRIHPLIENSMSNIFTQADRQVKMMTTYKHCGVYDNELVDHVIVESMRRGIINPAGIDEVQKHWHTPEHPEFEERTLWSLLNAFTSRDRERSPFGPTGHQKRMSDLTTLLDEKYDIDWDEEDDASTLSEPNEIIDDARYF